ncbi:hypothetical protein HPP92_002512 [Vanilla planifolia]|uniref:Uncharacterized protein n=1 Tax=Vanilla planifolia TaxID=51239 RepID=A0A835S0F6_VANPL|nr:hypothetical protein HPP92_002512 [Vanilla planifolia]
MQYLPPRSLCPRPAFPDHHHPLLIPIEDASAPSDGNGGLTYETLIGLGDPKFTWVRPDTEWAPMVLNYTSGTTSARRASSLHRGFSSPPSTASWHGCPLYPVYLWTLSMFHANGWCFPWAIAANLGTNVRPVTDGPTLFSAIADHRVTHLCAAPCRPHHASRHPTSRPPSSAQPGDEAYICPLITPRNCFRLAAATGGRAGSVESEAGVRTAVMDAADVVDEKTGRRCREMGRRGEVVMRWLSHDGLSRRRGGDGEGRRGGWFYTGDLAVVHPDGENISSVEVETVLYGHPAVAEAAVVANRTTTGETPCAFVVKKEGVGGSPTTEEELISWCREKMPHYMAPKTVVFQPEMPRTSTGKIQKNVLRTMARNLGASAAGQDGRGGVSPF